MKLISWNVNGLRACIQKGFLDQFDQFDADFFCLQETKLSEGQLDLDLPGYEQYWCYAEKKGYSGTAIFTKHTPQSVHYGLDVPELDKEGRLITLEYPEFYLVTCYTPNAQRGLARIDHRLSWDEAFRSYLQKLDAVKPVILCGDLNVAHKEIDLKNPASNRGNAGFSDQERDSFQQTLDLGFTDTFRHLHPDATGAYSWWSYMFKAREKNAGWRIDYFLVSDRLKEQIYRADIHSDVFGSDHCPVSLDISLICNGGIWSPMQQGKSRQILPDTQEKPKASAVSAKALVAINLLLAVILGAFFLWPENLPEFPSGDDPAFQVHVYSEPIRHQFRFSPSGYRPVYYEFTDGIEYFHTKTDIPDVKLTEYNAWIRVEALQPLLDALDDRTTLSYDLPDSFGKAHKIEILEYYTDWKYSTFGGWLVFLSIPEDARCTFTVKTASYSQSQTVRLFLDAGAPLSAHVYSEALGQDITFPNHLYDGTDHYYCPIPVDSDQLTATNYCIRVSPNTNLLPDFDENASIQITPSNPPAGLVFSSVFRNYYTDATYTDFGGWLIFGSVSFSADFLITVTTPSNTYTTLVTVDPFASDTVDPIPDDYMTVTTFQQPPLCTEHTQNPSAFYVSDTSSGFGAYINDLVVNKELSEYNSWFYVKPISGLEPTNLHLEARKNFYIGNADIFGSIISMNISETYADPQCTQFTGWLVYGDLDVQDSVQITLSRGFNYLETLEREEIPSAPYLPAEKAAEMATIDLIRFALRHSGIRGALYGAYITDAVYQPLETIYPVIEELESREDAIDLLMNMDLSSIDNGKQLSHTLLNLCFLQNMNPAQQADFLTGNYPNYPNRITISGIAYDLDAIAAMSDDALMKAAFDNSGVDELIQRSTNQEAAYQIFLRCAQDDPFLQEILRRSIPTCPYIACWNYIFERNEMQSVTTEDIIYSILTNADLCAEILYSTRSLATLSWNEPLLSTLQERSDAATAMLAYVPKPETLTQLARERLLAVFLYDKMTPEEAALFLTRLYEGSSRLFNFSLDHPSGDPANVSTSKLIRYLIDSGDDLEDMFTRVHPNDTQSLVTYEIHQLLLPYSDVLRELQTRDDTLALLRLHYQAEETPPVIISALLEIYESEKNTQTAVFLDASDWTQIGNYLSGTDPYLYAPYGSSSPSNASFAYFLTIPKERMDQYATPDAYTLQAFLEPSVTVQPSDPVHILPCYTDAGYTHFGGWLLFGSADEDASLQVNLWANTINVYTISIDISAAEE